MAKNINSKLTKLFLLSCANAAIMTAMAGEARADIEIYDILNHTPEYEALVPAQKLNVIKGIQAREDFGDLFDDLMPGERRLFNNEIIEVNKLQAVALVLNGARERREARVAGVAVDLTAGNTEVETGRNEQEMALENRLQVLEILAKAEGANAVSVNDKIKKAIHFNNIENLNTPLEQLKYIAMAGGVDANDNLKVVNNYVEAPLTKETFEHVFFATNITDPTVRGKDIDVNYYKPGQSDLLKKFKSVATPDTKRKLLNQFENYVTQNLVEFEANKSNITTRQAIIKLADPARLVTYLEKMAELKMSYIDNGKNKVVNEEGKLLDEAGLKNYNKILKDAGLITKDLDGKKMQALIDNFDAFTMSDLALILTKTVGEIKIDNERLVGLNNTMPPFRGAGGRPVRNLNNLDAIADLSPELKLAGHDLKAKEDAVVVVRGPVPVIGGAAAVEEALVVPNTPEGIFHNEMYLVKNTKNPEKLEVRTLGAESDLAITIKTLLTLEERKAPHESLALFSEANPDRAQLIIKAKNIWNRLKDDNLIKQTSRQALTLNNKIANGTFFEELFNEEEHNAIDRLNYTFGKLPLDLQNHITVRSNEIKIKDELQGKKTIISRIDYIAKNEAVLGANSLNNEIGRIVDNFNSLKFSDALDIALNKGDVRNNIAFTPKAGEVDIQVNNWINNNIVNLTVESNIDSGDLTFLQNKAAPATLSKIYEIGVDTKAKLLRKVLADNAADLFKASKNITEKNITDAVQNNFNAKMKALIPGTKDFSKEEIVKFLNVISDAKIEAVLKGVKTAKAARAPIVAPVVVIAGGPPPPPVRVVGYNGLGMDGLVRKMNSLKPIENLFPKKPDADVGEVVYIAPTSEIGRKYEDAVKVISAAADTEFKKELAIKTKGKEKLKALIVEEVFEKYTTQNADALGGDINQLAQAIQEGADIEFIGPKREVASGIDQEIRNLCVRMNQDAGLMQQLKTNNPRLAAVIEAAAVNEEEVATRLPESAAAQAVANGDVNYGGVVVVAPAAAPVVPVAPLVLPADPEEEEEEPIAAPVVINMEDVVVVPPPVEEALQADAEIMIVRHIDRIVPVEGNIEDFDDEDDDEDFEDENDDDIIREQTKVEVSSSTAVIGNKSESKDSEGNLENLKQEEAKVAASIKEAEEARIAEAVRVEAAEVVEMQTAVKEDKKIIGAIYNPIYDIAKMGRNIISNRMFSVAAVAAGDEDEKVLDKGLWIAGTIGTNKQKGASGYKGHASGGTIGFDIGSDNFKDLVGIAYTKLDSKFKSNGSKLNTTVDSHILALYGQKELPKNFMIQAMFAYNHNNVKSKINRLGTIAIGKYKNDNYNFETLLSYNHLMNGGITLTPNLGIRYGHSKDGAYQESDVGIQHLSIASKKQHLWSGILGGSVALAPQKIAESFSITPALQASVENYFNNKSKKLNAKVKWKDREINETVALPKQPKVGYNIGASVLTEKGNVSVTLEYNCHLQKKYQSHQGFVKLKVKL